MTVTKKDTEYVANLARLGMSEEEKDLYTGQLNNILSYIDVINSVDTGMISPTAYTGGNEGTPLREDKAVQFENVEKIIANAISEEDHMFRVPKIIGDSQT